MNHPWLIEPRYGLQLLDLFDAVRTGGSMVGWKQLRAMDDGDKQPKVSQYEINNQLFAKEGITFAPTDTWDLRNFKGFSGSKVAVIPVEGALMKSDYCGALGTASLRSLFQMAEQTKSVETILLLSDSPGGTVDGTQAFADVVRASKKNTISVIDGLFCSAMYWIGSSANKVVSTAKTDIIGSIGTKMSIVDNTEAMKQRGYVLREYNATRSVDKNRAGNLAQQGDGKVIIRELLDPLNNEFLAAVQANREGKIDLNKEDVLTGKTYTSQAALQHGLIDDIKSMDDVLTEAYNYTKPRKNSTTMSQGNNVFQKALAAAQATEFKVVDGGFLLTEADLNNIDAKLGQDASLMQSQSKELEGLRAQEESFKTNADAQTKLEAAEGKLVTANARIKELEATEESHAAAGKKFFGANGDKKDPAPNGEEKMSFEEETKDFAHNKTRDDFFED